MADTWADWHKLMATEGERWVKPHPLLEEFAAGLPAPAPDYRVYDLGCGAGRHTVYMAARGYAVYASDVEQSALDLTSAYLQRLGLTAELVRADMNAMPYPDAFFDVVLAIQVIYHNTRAGIETCLDEIRRVLKPGGRAFLVTSSEQSPHYGQGVQTDEHTFVRTEGHEAGIPHYYFTADNLRAMLGQRFTVERLFLHNQYKKGLLDPHYVAVAAKPA